MIDKLFPALLLSIFLATGTQSSAQVDSTIEKSGHYFNSFGGGILLGEDDEPITGSITMIHGTKVKKWRFGIGVGLEGYQEWRTLPVFFSFTFDFGAMERSALYLQLNAGYAHGWMVQDEPEGLIRSDQRAGPMLNTMFGYRIIDEKYNFTVAIGHKLQQTRYTYEYEWWNQNRVTVERDINRFFIQLGFGIN